MEVLHFLGEKKGSLPHTLNRTGHCLGNQRKGNTVLLKDDQIVFLPLVEGQLFHSNSDQINFKEAPMGPAQSTLSLGSALRVEVAVLSSPGCPHQGRGPSTGPMSLLQSHSLPLFAEEGRALRCLHDAEHLGIKQESPVPVGN